MKSGRMSMRERERVDGLNVAAISAVATRQLLWVPCDDNVLLVMKLSGLTSVSRKSGRRGKMTDCLVLRTCHPCYSV